MKAGPIVAMIALIFVGMWMVLQPTLSREDFDFEIRIGAIRVEAVRADSGYKFVSPDDLAAMGELSAGAFLVQVDAERAAWESRPAFEQTMLGFFNISTWGNFAWVAVGLGGQIAFFGRMMIQWVTSEKKRESVVPELFWWFSLVGGVCLFAYFVWRVDFVGVLGQSTGVVIYARNLRLIRKQRRRQRREVDKQSSDSSSESNGKDSAHARAAG